MNKIYKICYLTCMLIAIAMLPSTVIAADHPSIMVSIKPFYNICAKIMQNIGRPELLLHSNASPHDYHLKPSDLKLIDSAQLIIWGGPELEGYLSKALDNVAQDKILNLASIKGLRLLPLRTSIKWEAHDHSHTHNHDHHDHADLFDQHYWLDPDNAILIASAIAEAMSAVDPANAKLYSKNAADFNTQMKLHKKSWRQQLRAAQDKPYIVFHDAYQYFEYYFNLDGVGAISLNPEIPPSVQRIQQIQALLATEKVKCIFSEPQFNNKIIVTLANGLNIYQGILDPLGQDKDLGPNGYFTLLDNLTQQFVGCSKW